VLKQNPASGAVFCYCGRRGDRIKLLYWDGHGFCMYYKVLEVLVARGVRVSRPKWSTQFHQMF
jgi:transposase